MTCSFRRGRSPLAAPAASTPPHFVLLFLLTVLSSSLRSNVSFLVDAQDAFQEYDDYDEYEDAICCNSPGPLPSLSALRRVDTYERVDCSMTPEYFQQKYELPRVPAVIVGCDREWKGKRLWTIPRLMDRFSPRSQVRSKLSPVGGWDRGTFGDVQRAYREGRFWYVSDDLEDDQFKYIDLEYDVPPQFKGRDLYANFTDFPPDWLGGMKRWFMFGPKGSGTMPHIDPLGTDFWNSLISGYKWWIMFPPGLTSEEEVECDKRCSAEDANIQHWYAEYGVEAQLWSYAGERPMHILQGPGETLYSPDGRVHSVINMEETIAITANYAAEVNLNNIWKSILEDGTDEQRRRFYGTILTDEQRRKLMNTDVFRPSQIGA